MLSPKSFTSYQNSLGYVGESLRRLAFAPKSEDPARHLSRMACAHQTKNANGTDGWRTTSAIPVALSGGASHREKYGQGLQTSEQSQASKGLAT